MDTKQNRLSDDLIRKLLRETYNEALYSPDPSTQTGALTCDSHGNVFTRGSNRFPPEMKVTEELLTNKDEKYFHIGHAECIAIAKLVGMRHGQHPEDIILVCPWVACKECAKSIYWSGIRTIIGHAQRMELDHWSCAKPNALLQKCGVDFHFYDGQIGDVDPILVNGKLWYP